jgi:two-component system OmpR family sensor kinase
LRGRLVIPYLAVLGALLTGLCIFQTITLNDYFHSVQHHTRSAEAAILLHARLTLILGALAVFAVTALVALPIINRALRPLRRVTRAAEAIAAGELGRRAGLDRAVDEVGRLGRAFDTMVDRLETALGEATASEERMRRFLADASHELRTPLTVLRGSSHLLLHEKGLEPAEAEETLAAIHAEAVRLARLVDDLLLLSRMDAGQPPSPQDVPIRAFLSDLVRRYAPAWPAREILVEVGAGECVQAHVDPEALRRVLTNLIDNAARYSRPDGLIRLRAEERSGGVVITVEDDGPGLSAPDAARVLERFYRGGKSRSRATGGSGLGLAIVHALIVQSGGKIDIDTAPDRGTTVQVTLPAARQDKRESSPRARDTAA